MIPWHQIMMRTVDDGSCIFCADGETDVTFSFNQENVITDEVYVYNETDTVSL